VEEVMLAKKSDGKRSSTCDLRSECKAKWNRRYYERLLKDDWNYLVIRRVGSSRDYRIERV
jgi:hypothetical protein